MERKVTTEHLKLGMYITRLDRPWLETPFLLQGFYTKTDQDIHDLHHHCQFVYIDDDRGESANRYMESKKPTKPTLAVQNHDEVLPPRKIKYQTQIDLVEEISVARANQDKLFEQISTIMEDVKNRDKLHIESIKPIVTNMVESILRNPDAHMWLRTMQQTDTYLYTHAIDSSVLAVSFGRHLGFDRDELEDLAIGTMLFDIGKMKIPRQVLNKQAKLTEKEFTFMQRHVELGVKLIANNHHISQRAQEIVITHHERHNGKGYPQKLSGQQIPFFGKIAAIVDCYDAMTTQRPYADPISSHEAIMQLYHWRNIDFQEDLIEQFIQCLGLYPTGTIVLLNTGAVGIVISQNPIRRLRPKIMLILDENKQPLTTLPTIDLFQEFYDTDNQPLAIASALENGAFGIDPRHFFL